MALPLCANFEGCRYIKLHKITILGYELNTARVAAQAAIEESMANMRGGKEAA